MTINLIMNATAKSLAMTLCAQFESLCVRFTSTLRRMLRHSDAVADMHSSVSTRSIAKWYRVPESFNDGIEEVRRRNIMSEPTPTAINPSTNHSSLALSSSVVDDDGPRRYLSSRCR